METYIYAECPIDLWPEIKEVEAHSFNDAVEKIMRRYAKDFMDDEIENLPDFWQLQEYLNDQYSIAISELRNLEEFNIPEHTENKKKLNNVNKEKFEDFV